jgi:hypothetical protein
MLDAFATALWCFQIVVENMSLDHQQTGLRRPDDANLERFRKNHISSCQPGIPDDLTSLSVNGDYFNALNFELIVGLSFRMLSHFTSSA